MKTVIIAWAKYGMQEFFLPGIHNADHRIHFEKEMFRLEEDLDVKLEIYDEEWRIFPDETYVVKMSGNRRAIDWRTGACIHWRLCGDM